MKDYAQFLVRRFAVPHFCKSVIKVHIVLDSPGQNLRTPKAHLSNAAEMPNIQCRLTMNIFSLQM